MRGILSLTYEVDLFIDINNNIILIQFQPERRSCSLHKIQ